ncbi:MAG: cell division protein ZapA [Intestinibacillus sp.]
MRNRVTLHIAGESYVMLSDETETYMQEIAARVDSEISEAKKIPGISSMRAAVLAACNIADDYYKSVRAADNLRAQMKNYLEEASSLRRELADAQKLLDELTEPDSRTHRGGKR